jgi:agmatine deiminase
MPAEWETHQSTWIAWPHEETDYPGKLDAVRWVYAEIVRLLSTSERVNILVQNAELEESARRYIALHRGVAGNIFFHRVKTDRAWLRDSMPIGVFDAAGEKSWISWDFKAWAKYENFLCDEKVFENVGEITGLPILDAKYSRFDIKVSLEGGSIDVDGEGTLLTTEECLLSTIQERNHGFGREDYEQVFSEYLGANKVIWLGRGCVGDDTHGHIDDIARFVAPGKVLLAYEANKDDENHEASEDNYRRLLTARDAKGRKLEVIKLPMPNGLWWGDDRLPASYANFYISNSVVIVPTFNDENDRTALEIIAAQFPGRRTVGIHAVDLVLGLGTLHCLTQQEPG